MNIRRTPGAVLKSQVASGTKVFTGDASTSVFNIPHGLGKVPATYSAVPASVVARGSFHVTADATNVIVNFAAAPASGASNITIAWSASL